MKAAPYMEEETLKMIRQEVADYMYSEGCSCYQDIEAHKEQKKRKQNY